MRWAIFSDVHSNEEALKSCLEVIADLDVTYVLCLGDITGYGPKPGHCVRMVRDVCNFLPPLLGNHDHAGIDPQNIIEGTNPSAAAAMLWTHEQLRQDGLMAFLDSLSPEARHKRIQFVHGTPLQPLSDYLFPKDMQRQPEKVEAIFAGMTDVDAVFCGHTHFPAVFSMWKGRFFCDEQKVIGSDPFPLKAGGKYIVNVGSVGQPRDGSNRVSSDN